MGHHSTWTLVGRWIGSILFALVAACTVPILAIEQWLNDSVLDTDAFVDLLLPLADDPEFQGLLADTAGEQVSSAVRNSIPAGAVESLATTVGQLADLLPLDTTIGTTISEFPDQLADQVGEVARAQTLRYVESDQFPSVWKAALTEIHGQLVGAVSGERTLPESDSGNAILTIDVAPIMDAVKAALSEQGEWWAQYVPSVDTSVTVVEIVDLPQIQRYYSSIQEARTWLFIFAASVAILAVVLAPKRLLLVGVMALMTFGATAIAWRNVPGFGEQYFHVLPTQAAVDSSVNAWALVSAPLLTTLEGYAGTAILIAVIALAAALIVYLVTGRRKRTRATAN